MLKKWDKTDQSLINMNEASEYLIKNKKCKLPWTIDEVKSSIQSFASMIKDLNPDAKFNIEDFNDLDEKL